MKLSVRALFISLLLLNVYGLNAQDIERCGTFERHQEKMNTDSEYAQQYFEKMSRIDDWLRDNRDETKSDCDEILYLPVAVHYQNVGIDMACAIDMAVDQVRILNEDFGGTNADLQKFLDAQPTTWPGIQNKNSCVQFCLATLNHPDGSGIPEGDYAITLNEYDEIDNIPEWSGYLNMFVRPMQGVLGYSPLGGNGNGDGVVCGIQYFGSVNCGGNTLGAQYNLGRTATHEIGHYLSLSHPFDSGDCVTDGDGIGDTPLTDEATYGCYADGEEIVHCTEPKLWPSYMDYCDDACLYMFSEGQVDQMEAYVNTSLTNLLDGATIKCEDAACVGFDVDFISSNETCAGNDASITFVADGGTEPYSYSITNGLTSSGNNVFNNLTADKYYLYVVDDQGCEYIDSVVISQETPPMEVVRSRNSFCGDDSGLLEVRVNHPDDFEFSIGGTAPWQDTAVFDNLTAGNYTVVARSEGGCTNEINVTIFDDSDLNVIEREIRPVNCPLSDNGLIYLELGNGEEPIIWKFEDENPTDDAYFDNLSPGVYSVVVQDGRGCREENTYTIGVSYTNVADDCPCQVFVPNAITPDEDGKNDVFKVVPSCPISDYEIIIVDRWGDVVFESKDPEDVWNGGEKGYYSPPSVFFYRINYRWGEELNESLERETITGTITVLR